MKTAPSVEPYLTFQSVNPFTISVASPKWDGTMEYSTDTENWFTWNGSSISSVDGKIYLRGTGNTRVSSDSNGNYSSFIINGTAVECVGNIETLLDWQTAFNGEHPTMSSRCFFSAFRNCSALITAPALPANNLAEYCYNSMFNGCTNLKISTTQSGIYQYAWRIPESGTISSTYLGWNTDMFKNTGGTFTGNPTINTTYYVENQPVSS